MAVVVFVLVASAAYSIKKQTDSLKTFTEEEAKPAPIADPTGHETEFNSLIARLRHFDHEVQNKRPAELALSPLDLNIAIAHFDLLKNFRGQFHFEKITGQEISGTLHFPLNSTANLPEFIRGPLNIDARENNINGTFIGTPLLTDGKLILNFTEIKTAIGEMPEEVFASLSRSLISGELEKAYEDDPKNPPELLTTLKKLTSLETREGELVFGYQPDGTPPSVKGESDAMATKAKQLVALGAVIFILTMILLFILLSRRQKAKRAAAQG